MKYGPTGLITPDGKSEDGNSSENTQSGKVDTLQKKLKIVENPILQKNPKVKEKLRNLSVSLKMYLQNQAKRSEKPS